MALRLDQLSDLCARHGLVCKANHETGELAILHRVLDEDAPLFVVPHADRNVVAFELPLPFRVPAARVPYIGEAITRLNAAAVLGAWRLDVETGELAFRVALPAYGADYADDGVLFVTRLIWSAVDDVAGALREIALGTVTSLDLWPRAGNVPRA